MNRYEILNTYCVDTEIRRYFQMVTMCAVRTSTPIQTQKETKTVIMIEMPNDRSYSHTRIK